VPKFPEGGEDLPVCGKLSLFHRADGLPSICGGELMKRLCSLVFSACLMVLTTVACAQVTKSGKGAVNFENSPDINSPSGYSHVAIVNSGKIVFISGQVGLTKEGQMAGDKDFRAQSMQAFVNLKAALVAAGATTENLVKLNYYVVGLDHEKLLALRDVRDRFISQQHPPTSTLAGVEALFRVDALIEIEGVAVIP
jgi:2-iminobutanoate/2-iminopropanoate deaminase